jgi:hypothetical protein
MRMTASPRVLTVCRPCWLVLSWCVLLEMVADERFQLVANLGFGQTELAGAGNGSLCELAKLLSAVADGDAFGPLANPHPQATNPLDGPFGLEP